MNEEYWEFGLGGVLAVPVGKMLDRRLLNSEKGLRPEREEGEKSREGGAVKVEIMAEERHVCQEIDEANTTIKSHLMYSTSGGH